MHSCWWPGDARREAISNHVIDIFHLEDSARSSGMVDMQIAVLWLRCFNPLASGVYVSVFINVCVIFKHISVIATLSISCETAQFVKPRALLTDHDDVIKWKHFPRNWPFVRGIHRSPVNSPHKGQWRGALMFSLICVWINDWVNNREAGDLRRYRAHYDVIVMW